MPQNKKYPSDAQRQAAYRRRTVQAREAQLAARALPILPAIPTLPGYVRWKAMLNQARVNLHGVTTEMQNYYDERSQSWQESERGDGFVEHMEAIRDVLDSLDDLN
jgi:hypothetical protein